LGPGDPAGAGCRAHRAALLQPGPRGTPGGGDGRDEACRQHATRALELARQHNFGSSLPFAESALGLLALGRGQCGEAILHLEETARLCERIGLREPGRLEWQADLVEAYSREGLVEEASQVLDDLERRARARRRPAERGGPTTACTLANAAAARCRGILASGLEADARFGEALAWHARTRTPFERGRTELCFGEQLRRGGRRVDARRHLRAAIALFEELGADPWTERAQGELAATGESVTPRNGRHLVGLTPQELQVALLVGGGATNREAAAVLFLTPKTIEFHLAKIYRKLDLRSRTELACWVAAQAPVHA
jgi:DNA-binding CsgD family transcriptional regulator